TTPSTTSPGTTTPSTTTPSTTTPSTTTPGTTTPGTTAPDAGTPGQGAAPSPQTGAAPTTGTGEAGAALGAERGGQGAGGGVAVNACADPGSIDLAVPRTQLRFRFNSLYDNNRPDRADFFYPKCGCIPNSPGLGPNMETKVDAQEFSAYLETAVNERLS